MPGVPSRRSQIVTQDDLGERHLDLGRGDVGHAATDPGLREGSNLGTHHVGKAQALSCGQCPNGLE